VYVGIVLTGVEASEAGGYSGGVAGELIYEVVEK